MNFATGVSSDLKVSAIYGDPAATGVWSDATDWVTIPSSFESGCDALVGGAWDISQDGDMMVGFDWNGCSVQAMRWTQAGGTWTAQPLELIGAPFPDSPNPPSNRAYGRVGQRTGRGRLGADRDRRSLAGGVAGGRQRNAPHVRRQQRHAGRDPRHQRRWQHHGGHLGRTGLHLRPREP